MMFFVVWLVIAIVKYWPRLICTRMLAGLSNSLGCAQVIHAGIYRANRVITVVIRRSLLMHVANFGIYSSLLWQFHFVISLWIELMIFLSLNPFPVARLPNRHCLAVTVLRMNFLNRYEIIFNEKQIWYFGVKGKPNAMFIAKSVVTLVSVTRRVSILRSATSTHQTYASHVRCIALQFPLLHHSVYRLHSLLRYAWPWVWGMPRLTTRKPNPFRDMVCCAEWCEGELSRESERERVEWKMEKERMKKLELVRVLQSACTRENERSREACGDCDGRGRYTANALTASSIDQRTTVPTEHLRE